MSALSDKLASSGLTEADGEALGIYTVDATRARAELTAGRDWRGDVMVIPYWNVDGTPMKDRPEWPECPQYYRSRALAGVATAKALTGKSGPKYLQPAGTLPCVYYPRLIPWDDVANDPGIDIILTEGELKAAAACKAGFATIGLGGVDAYQAKYRGVDFLQSFSQIVLARRSVTIVFDSDISTNANVARAVGHLVEQLTRAGAYPSLAFLSSIDDRKCGLDDFLLHYGAAGPFELSKVVAGALPMGTAKTLYGVNRHYAIVRADASVVELASGRTWGKNDFLALEAGGSVYIPKVEVVETEGVKKLEVKVKAHPTVTEWWRWPLRNTVEALTYAPGQGQITDKNEFNQWRGWGCESIEGDVSLFTQFFDYLTSNDTPEGKRFTLQWLAYPFQHPGTKMYTGVVIWSTGKGVGKTLLGYTMRELYGIANTSEISRDDLEGSFNEWESGKQFILAEEISGSEKRRDADKLKKIITAHEVRVNIKYGSKYTTPATANFLFTSNDPVALFIENGDRRYHVIAAPSEPLPQSFYDAYDAFYRSPEGAAAIRWYLEHVDLTGFNPRGRAPESLAKELMVETGRSDHAAWCHHLLDNPDYYLRVGNAPLTADLYTSTELLALYANGNHTRVTANTMSRAMTEAGAQRAYKARTVVLRGHSERYWILRNKSRWLNASHAEIVEHLEANQATGKKIKY